MRRIRLNLQNAINEEKLKEYVSEVEQINTKMNNLSLEGFEYLGWKDLPENINKNEIDKIIETANFFKKEGIEVLVVIGIGGSFLGAKSAMDFIQGNYPTKKNMEIIFAGTSISSTELTQLLYYVENKKFAINVISKSGTTLEPAIAFREFRNLLNSRLGENNAKRYIVATTDANKGLLFEMAKEKGYARFVVPDNVGGRFSVLTPVGLLPLACAGIDIEKLLEGAKEANALYKNSNLLENDAYKYAVARFLLQKKFPVEMLVSYEPNHMFLLEWWKQLFGESEGKQGKGILPHSAIFTRDLHSLGQFIQDGSKIMFETVIWVDKPIFDLKIEKEIEDLDKLNYLTNKSLHQINKAAFEATVEAHTKVGLVPNIILELEDSSEKTLGALFMFFERAVAMSGYLLKVNPFNQPGVEVYKSNLFKILEKK
ncbi:GLUCOSE-6-PHOSPHATE ISOMERASE (PHOSPHOGLUCOSE ISOMERASE) [Mycoplasmopsis pulmonis]|uniref:Glucose-6-phosphate isomerase n=1 Tax=Mycoplasmopsis pulmonis (strain UAB CTIP) TaxID=272635 RepID=G6PI_MYCPU|nr:glucose-6-phosphate isomerase [Mycoplasmopsis pulmonis]Q98R79.1 RecName: Full=Glucose-6-phosphate isomerase; Short=GPI; AltName: Full=Phosphoglucose isomerase; Short=PGI; AltName: Full=Phosphohexose isomerase; Short=PHI [Mycoplasmopsis pulmonis UAB CTIP]MDZ7293101.1 glucose-6-phosphate isomerase [Mycoplasmopsis pulmonis]CAC13304.1 GLUCOSE-6-PHOSPHATE ISOMERASE (PHOSPHOGLUCOSE ISOMERASE) [Mycoplasmopsis pulmonis]VEU67896.1 Glucose-6-phosphate isomerase [Mycoplasmopsis pulmonis]